MQRQQPKVVPGGFGSTAARDPKSASVTGHDANQAAPYVGKSAIEPAGPGEGSTTPPGSRTTSPPGRPSVTAQPDLAEHVPYRSPRPLVAVRLDTNESPYPPQGALRADLAALAGNHDWHRYGDLDALALRERLAGRHGRPDGGG
jgi:hypothetical protein